ncbi:hypothetical protein [Neptuniibacter sp. QD37_11]|uniref:hypothetical protein n=1 Tax=Neptuniibacter sp. QD37_11 TaxID=3398209 RepID=UPI0039F600C5
METLVHEFVHKNSHALHALKGCSQFMPSMGHLEEWRSTRLVGYTQFPGHKRQEINLVFLIRESIRHTNTLDLILLFEHVVLSGERYPAPISIKDITHAKRVFRHRAEQNKLSTAGIASGLEFIDEVNLMKADLTNSFPALSWQ